MIKRRSKKRGFTLIELIIAVVLLAILISIALIKWQNVSQTAREVAFEANHRMLISAYVYYRARHNMQEPPDIDALMALIQDPFSQEPVTATYTLEDGVIVSNFEGHNDPTKRTLKYPDN